MLRAYLAMFAVAASLVTAAPRSVEASASCALTAHPLLGHYAASKTLRGPGLWLDGGNTLPESVGALHWVHDTIAGRKAGRFGNLVLLRVGSNKKGESFTYDVRLIYNEGRFASVRELLIPPCASALQIAKTARYLDRADVVFFLGGDLSRYAAWRGTPLMAAVKRVYARGGVVGGNEAGLAIQGALASDATAAGGIHSRARRGNDIVDPLQTHAAFMTSPFSWPALRGTIVVGDFAQGGYFGRMVVSLALIRHQHLLAGNGPVYGLGIDRGSEVTVGSDGTAIVYLDDGGLGAYLVRASGAPLLKLGEPLDYGVDLVHVARNGERFGLLRKRASEAWLPIEVNGKAKPPYDAGIYRQ